MKTKLLIGSITSFTLILGLTTTLLYSSTNDKEVQKDAEVNQTQLQNVQALPKEVVEDKTIIESKDEKVLVTTETLQKEEKVVAATTPQVTVTATPITQPKQQAVEKAPQAQSKQQVVEKAPQAQPKPQVVEKAPKVQPKPQVVEKAPKVQPKPQVVEKAPQAQPKPQVVEKAPEKIQNNTDMSDAEYEAYLKLHGVDMTEPEPVSAIEGVNAERGQTLFSD